MTLGIHVMPWDRHTNVAELKRINEIPIFKCKMLTSYKMMNVTSSHGL